MFSKQYIRKTRNVIKTYDGFDCVLLHTDHQIIQHCERDTLSLSGSRPHNVARRQIVADVDSRRHIVAGDTLSLQATHNVSRPATDCRRYMLQATHCRRRQTDQTYASGDTLSPGDMLSLKPGRRHIVPGGILSPRHSSRRHIVAWRQSVAETSAVC